MTICKWCLAAYGLVALLALAAIPMSALGWIAPDPLSAVPAILVGAPWSVLLVSLEVTDSVSLNVLLRRPGNADQWHPHFSAVPLDRPVAPNITEH